MRKLASLSLALIVASPLACGGTQKKNDGIEQDPVGYEDIPVAEGEKPKPGHLQLVAITLNTPGQVVTIDEKGRIEAGGTHIGTVTGVGEFLAPNGGLFGTLMPDGSLIKAHVNLDRFAGIRVGEDGVLVKKSEETGEDVRLNEISETGDVSENGNVGFTIEGPAEGRRMAMFVYLVLVGSAMDEQERANPPAPGSASK